MAKLSSSKARKILKDKEVRGHKLTKRQKRFFGFIAGGGTTTRLRKNAKRRKYDRAIS